MIIESFWDFFKKNEPAPDPVDNRTRDNFTVDRFNDWFQNEESSYGGYPGGSKGIYLRTDKLSLSFIENFVQELVGDVGDVSDIEMMDFEEEVRKDWTEKRNTD